jgi:hypothetical protein
MNNGGLGIMPSLVFGRGRGERVVVVCLRVRVERVSGRTEVDDRLAVAADGAAHVPARCEGHEQLIDARLDLECL